MRCWLRCTLSWLLGPHLTCPTLLCLLPHPLFLCLIFTTFLRSLSSQWLKIRPGGPSCASRFEAGEAQEWGPLRKMGVVLLVQCKLDQQQACSPCGPASSGLRAGTSAS